MNYKTVQKVESIFRRIVNPNAIAEFADTFQNLIDISTNLMDAERQQITDNELLNIKTIPSEAFDAEWEDLSNRWESLLNDLETKIRNNNIQLSAELPQKNFLFCPDRRTRYGILR